MIVIDKIEYRNLEEQVRKNQEDIAATKFGLNIVGTVLNVPDLPADANIGDAFLVGRNAPFYVYVKTGNPKTYVNVGTLASTVPGPKGDRGEEGTPGIRGSKWYIGRRVPQMTSDIKHNDMYLNAITGVVYQAVLNDYGALYWAAYDSIRGPMGVPGPKGDKGIQGVPGSKGDKGEKGDSGQAVKLVGIVSSTDQLPTPTESIRDNGYLVGNQSDGYNLYVIIGASSLEWFNTGKFQQVLPPFGTTPNTIYEGSEGQANRDRINLIVQKLADKAEGFELGSVKWGKELIDRIMDDEYQYINKVLIMDVTSYGTLIGNYSPYGNCIGVYDRQQLALTVINGRGAYILEEGGYTTKIGNLDGYLTQEEFFNKFNPIEENIRLNNRDIELINNLIENISTDYIATEWKQGIASEITRPEGALPNYIVDIIGGNTRKCNNIWDERWEVGKGIDGLGNIQTLEGYSMSKNFIPVIPSSKYYFAYNSPVFKLVRINTYDLNRNKLRTMELDLSYQHLITLNPNEQFIKFSLNDGEPKTVMLNFGSEPLPYESYFPGLKDTIVDEIGYYKIPAFVQELKGYGAGINEEYHNYIVLTDDHQIFYKVVSDVILLDGSENWFEVDIGGGKKEFGYEDASVFKAIQSNDTINVKSSYIDSKNSLTYSGLNGIAVSGIDAFVYVEGITTLEQFKAWLRANPIQLRYALSDEAQTDVELPEDSQIPLPIIGSPTCEISNTERDSNNKAFYSITYQRRIK